jgi:hypothetical protein
LLAGFASSYFASIFEIEAGWENLDSRLFFIQFIFYLRQKSIPPEEAAWGVSPRIF